MLDRLATPAHGLWVRIGAHLRAHDPATPYDLACFGAHRWSLERPWRVSATLLVFWGKERTRDAIGRACNLYSITTNQEAIRALFRLVNRYVGNLAPMPGVFPDYPGPVIRNTDDGREMTLMRWACRRPADL